MAMAVGVVVMVAMVMVIMVMPTAAATWVGMDMFLMGVGMGSFTTALGAVRMCVVSFTTALGAVRVVPVRLFMPVATAAVTWGAMHTLFMAVRMDMPAGIYVLPFFLFHQ